MKRAAEDGYFVSDTPPSRPAIRAGTDVLDALRDLVELADTDPRSALVAVAALERHLHLAAEHIAAVARKHAEAITGTLAARANGTLRVNGEPPDVAIEITAAGSIIVVERKPN